MNSRQKRKRRKAEIYLSVAVAIVKQLAETPDFTGECAVTLGNVHLGHNQHGFMSTANIGKQILKLCNYQISFN